MSEIAVFVRASNMDYIIFAIKTDRERIAWTTRRLIKWRLELDHYYPLRGNLLPRPA